MFHCEHTCAQLRHINVALKSHPSITLEVGVIAPHTLYPVLLSFGSVAIPAFLCFGVMSQLLLCLSRCYVLAAAWAGFDASACYARYLANCWL